MFFLPNLNITLITDYIFKPALELRVDTIRAMILPIQIIRPQKYPLNFVMNTAKIVEYSNMHQTKISDKENKLCLASTRQHLANR